MAGIAHQHNQVTIKGEKVSTAKLTEADVRAIRALDAQGVTGMEIARQFNVHKSTIYKIRDGESWQHVK